MKFRVLVMTSLVAWSLQWACLVPLASAGHDWPKGILVPDKFASVQPALVSAILTKINDIIFKLLLEDDDYALNNGRLCKKYIDNAFAAGMAKDTLIKWYPTYDGGEYSVGSDLMMLVKVLRLDSEKLGHGFSVSLADVSELICVQRGINRGWAQIFTYNAHFILRRIRAFESSPLEGDLSNWQINQACPAENIKPVLAEIEAFIASDLAECATNVSSARLEVSSAMRVDLHKEEQKLEGTSITDPDLTIGDVEKRICNVAMRLATQRIKQLKTQEVARAQEAAARQAAAEKQAAAESNRFLGILTSDKQSVFQRGNLLQRLPLRGRGGRRLATPQDFAESAGWYICTVNATGLVPTWSVDGWRFNGDRLDVAYHETGIGAEDCPTYAFP